MAKANGDRRLPKKDYEARIPALRAALVRMQVALQHAPFPVLLVVVLVFLVIAVDVVVVVAVDRLTRSEDPVERAQIIAERLTEAAEVFLLEKSYRHRPKA